MAKYIKKDDIWGIRKAVRSIWNSEVNKSVDFSNLDYDEIEIAFNAFFNQFIPATYKETRETVLRHRDEILEIIKSKGYQVKYIWLRQPIKGGNSLKCCLLNNSTLTRLAQTKEELPTYEEIEAEKIKWQANERYDKINGFSVPIKEEYVQLKFISRGGV
jgi:hypothetical protein